MADCKDDRMVLTKLLRMANVMGRLITNKMLIEYFGLLDLENIYKEMHRKRERCDLGIEFNVFLIRQYEFEEQARLLIEADICGNW